MNQTKTPTNTTSICSASGLMNVDQIATYLNIGRNKVYIMLENGTLPGFKLGSSWRSTKEAIDLHIKKLSGMI